MTLFVPGKRLLWVSTALLFGAYATFGRFLHNVEAPDFVWILAGMAAGLQACILTVCARSTGLFLNRWLKSDSGYFIAVVSTAFLAAALVVWFDISAHILVLLATGLLARLETLMVAFKDIQAFLLLFMSSGTGLALSWILAHFGI